MAASTAAEARPSRLCFRLFQRGRVKMGRVRTTRFTGFFRAPNIFALTGKLKLFDMVSLLMLSSSDVKFMLLEDSINHERERAVR